MSRASELRWIAMLVPVLFAAAACNRAREVRPDKSWYTCPVPAPGGTDSFGGSMRLAMALMDAAMMAAAPTGDPDRDFAAMMIPHHQGAVDMALAELRFGHDERLRRLASGIVVEQRSEIALMQQIIDKTAPIRVGTETPSQTALVQGARQ